MNPTDHFEVLLIALLNQMQRQIQGFYYAAIVSIAASAAGLRPKSGQFSMKKYPTLNKAVKREIETLHAKIYSAVADGVNNAWGLSNDKNKVFVDETLKGMELTPKAKRIYYDTHDNVKEAFLDEKIAGKTLSDRVWKIAEGFQTEIELGVQQGIGTGESATSMARRMKKYLRVPDNRFRDVKDDKLRKELQKKAAANHPGQGVYRSSYKNALRLTRDRVNRAYRTADYERWQTIPFVVGIEIELSNNHPLKPEHEMCEQLAGKYPKGFKWTGWHIQCLCHATAITITKEEMKRRTRAIINGEKWDGKSENEVTDIPESVKRWVAEHAELEPDFLTDNREYFSTH